MRSIRTLSGIGLLAFTLLAVGAVPTAAASRWDPDDASGPLDIRWVGAYALAGHQTKVTITFWDDVTDRALSGHVLLRYESPEGYPDAFRLEGKPGHLHLKGWDDGFCDFADPGPTMIRVSPTTIRFLLYPVGGSWRAIARRDRCGGGVLDASPWVPVT